MIDYLKHWKDLGKAGIIVSVCYGPMGPSGEPMFSVTAMSPTGDTFSNPFAANSLEHAIEIALAEARIRGWYLN